MPFGDCFRTLRKPVPGKAREPKRATTHIIPRQAVPPSSRVHTAWLADRRVWTEKGEWGRSGAYAYNDETAYWDGYWGATIQTPGYYTPRELLLPGNFANTPTRDTVLHEVGGHVCLKIGHHGVANAVMGGPHTPSEAPEHLHAHHEREAWANGANDNWRSIRSPANYDADRAILEEAMVAGLDYIHVRRATEPSDLP